MQSLTASKSISGFDPRSIPGLALWLDAADSSTLTFSSGSNISAWRDKSSNGYVCSNAVGTSTLTQNTLNGYNSVFTPISNAMGISNFSWRTKFTAFIVARAATSGYYLIGQGGANRVYIFAGNWDLLNIIGTSSTLNIYDSVNNLGVSITGTNPFMLATGYDNATNSTASPYTLNGTVRNTRVSSTSATVVDQTITNTFYINSLNGTAANTYDNVNTGEILIYNDSLTTTQRQFVEGYLANKWGLAGSVLGTHPFRYIAPFSRQFNLPTDGPPGLALWLDAADQSSMTFSSGSNVTQWNDKSGNGVNFTVTTGSVNTVIDGGYNVINFPGTSTMTSVSSMVLTTSHSIFTVAKVPGTGFNYLVSFTNLKPSDNANGISGDYSIRYDGGALITPTSGNGGDIFFNNTGGYYANGTLSGNPTISSYHILSGRLSQGGTTPIALSFGGVSSRFLTGTVAEIIIFSQVLTTAQRQQIEGYLAWKWNTPAGSRPAYKFYKFQVTELIGGAGFGQYAEFRLYNGSTMVSLSGGTAEATPNNTNGGEGPAQAIDNNVNTKVGNNSPLFTLTITLSTAVVATAFAYVTANDNSFRDPSRWIVSGSTDNVNYAILHTQSTTYQPPTGRFTETARFVFNPPAWGQGSHPFALLPPDATLPFTPTMYGGLAAWFDGADNTTNSMTFSGTSITVWKDKSGNGRNATASNGPILLGSKGGVVLASSGYFSVPGLSGTLVTTPFAVFIVESGNSGWLFGDDTNGGTRAGLHLGVNASTVYFNLLSDDINYGALGGADPHPIRLWCFRLSLTGRQIRLNGTTVATGNGNQLTAFANPIIGRVFSGNYFTGTINEMVIYNSNYVDEQIMQIEAALAWKWGLQTALPAPLTGAATLDPGTVSGIVIRSDATAITGVSNGSVISTWVNSGTGGTVNCGGTYVTNGLGTKPVVRLTTSQQWTPVSAPTLNAYTMFWVGRQRGGTNGRVLSHTYNNQLYGYWNGQKRGLYIDGNPQNLSGFGGQGGQLSSDSAWDLMSHSRTAGGAYMMNWNGAALFSGASSSGQPLSGIQINAHEASDCEIAEFILYNSVLTSTQVGQIEKFLQSKWGVGGAYVSNPYTKVQPGSTVFVVVAPAGPTGFSVTLPAGANPYASWTAPPGAVNYSVKLYNSANTLLASNTTSGVTTTFTFTMTNGTAYYATIIANNSGGSSPLVTSATVTYTLPIPNAPSGLSLSMPAGANSTASWTASATSTSYTARLYNASGPTLLVTNSGLTGTSTTFVSTLVNANNYYFTVTATNSTGTSSPAQSSTGTYSLPVPVAPTNLALGTFTGSGTASWTAPANTTSYNAYLYSSVPASSATGGTVTTSGGTTYHVFTSSSSLSVTGAGTMNYLVVGGGGGGGDRHGGGGGAGGLLSGTFSASATSYTVTVGAAGIGGNYETNNSSPRGAGIKGGDSSISSVVTANGGGGGGTYDGNPGGTVGSGGGGGGNNFGGVAGTSGQGNAGGSGAGPGGGGGGGAGGTGSNANTSTGGIGSSALSATLLAVGYGTSFAVPTSPNVVISGGVAYIAGGGGGAAGNSPGPGGAGGLGGGGRGDWNVASISVGSPNTGGGGGGSRSEAGGDTVCGQNGGTGLVIVWYSTTPTVTLRESKTSITTLTTTFAFALTVGSQYYFTVAGINATGTGALGTSSTVTYVQYTIFNPTGAYQYYTVPAGKTSIYVVAWGGGGGGVSGYNSSYGGGGACVKGFLPVTAGEVLTIVVGYGSDQGGTRAVTDQNGGGSGGNGRSTGGGRTAIQRTAGNDVFTVGGGGCGGMGNTAGGAATASGTACRGGDQGQTTARNGSQGGGGGQSSGGEAGTGTSPGVNGSKGFGGLGAVGNAGGGWYGGGGSGFTYGQDFSGSANGGGGSSYIDNLLLTGRELFNGSGTDPGNKSDPMRNGTCGQGAQFYNLNGGPGILYIAA